jgi:hypothetical protein
MWGRSEISRGFERWSAQIFESCARGVVRILKKDRAEFLELAGAICARQKVFYLYFYLASNERVRDVLKTQ